MLRSEAARRSGKSRSAITQACREGGPLFDAVVGRRIDWAHPAVTEWLSTESRGPVGSAPTPVTREEMLRLARRKKEAETLRLELANAEKQGQIISRELVRHHLLGALDAYNQRLLSDFCKTISVRVAALARSGVSTQELERTVRGLISGELEAIKRKALRLLRARQRRMS